MSTPEPHSTQRVARPEPGGEQGWLALVLDRLPVPALVVDTATGRVVVRNRAAAGVPPEPPTQVTVGTEATPGPENLLLRLVTDTAGEDGIAVAWPTPGGDA